MTISYRRLAMRCRTVNELNRLHIRLEDRLTLAEINLMKSELTDNSLGNLLLRTRRVILSAGRLLVLPRVLYRLVRSTFVDKDASRDAQERAGLHNGKGSGFSKESYLWFERIDDWAKRSRKENVEAYSRRRLMPNVMAYYGSGESRNKTLLVCMTGKSFRMMVPVSILLQHLPADTYDVIVLKDPTRRAYRHGLRGLGGNLVELTDNIGRMIDQKPYRDVVTLGVSAGGLPALLVCLSLQCSKGIAIAGNSPEDPRWQSYDGGLQQALERLGNQPGYDPNLLVIYGADHVRDKESSLKLAEKLPAQLLEVRSRSVGLEIGHNVLYPILAQFKLAEFLATVVDPEINGYSGAATAGRISYLT